MSFSLKPDEVKAPYQDLPRGALILRVADYELRKTSGDGGKTEKLMIPVKFEGLEPADILGVEKTEYFVIGCDADDKRGRKADPLAQLPETWKMRMGGLKALADACGWPADKEIQFQPEGEFIVPKALLEFIRGKKVGNRTKQEHEPQTGRDGQPNQYAGRVRTRFGQWLPAAKVKPSIDAEQMEPIDYTRQPGTAPAPQPGGVAAPPPPPAE